MLIHVLSDVIVLMEATAVRRSTSDGRLGKFLHNIDNWIACQSQTLENCDQKHLPRHPQCPPREVQFDQYSVCR